MMVQDILDSQIALELPAREMLSYWTINIAVPIQISNNINVQVCGIGIGNIATCSNNQWNLSEILINYS